MIRHAGFSGFPRFISTTVATLVAVVFAISCSESTGPEMTPQPSSADVRVVEFYYPDSVKNADVNGSATRLANLGISANAVAPEAALSAAAAGGPSYTVAAIPFKPESAPTVMVDPSQNICENCVVVNVPLGFTFAFYGQSFTKMNIGAKGIVGFGPLDAQSKPIDMTDGCCSARFINRKDVANNIIAVGWGNWTPVTRSQIKYETRGSAPNRRFLMQFTNIGEDGGNGHITAQLILYEGSNAIEIHTTELSTQLTRRVFTQGIENLGATETEFIAGRDSAKFALANDGVRFTPVSPNKPPVVTQPADLKVNTDAGVCVAKLNPVAPSFTDDAAGATINGVRNDAGALNGSYPKGTTGLTWTATDVEGLQTIVNQSVIVSDNEKPALAAVQNVTLRTNVGFSSAVVNLVAPAVTTDNCADATVTGVRSDDAPITNTRFPIGVTTVTWTAKDGAGNLATVSQTITVTGNVPPSLGVPDNIVARTDLGKCFATVNLGNPWVKDDVLGASVTGVRDDDQPLNSPFKPGTTTITWTATDADQAQVSAKQTVDVSDPEPPVLGALQNISVRQDRGVPRAAVSLTQPAASDNCGNVEVTIARSDNMPRDAAFAVGVTTVTWTAVDGAKNVSKVSQTVTVVGNVPPSISALKDIVANTDRSVCVASVSLSTPSVTDDIDGWTLKSERSDNQPLSAPYAKGVTTVKWTATDYDNATSSSSQTVTVQDKENPSLVVPRDQTDLETDTGRAYATVNTGWATATDNCREVSVEGVRSDRAALGAAYPVGTTTIVWTASDPSGNKVSATQTIKVSDKEAPRVFVPEDYSVNATSPAGAIVVYADLVRATDNVGVVSFVCTPASGTMFPMPYTHVDCVARDAAGNSTSAEFGVKVLNANEQILNLIEYVQSLGLSNGVENPLVNQLKNAAKDNTVAQQCTKMDDFVHMVSVKNGSLTLQQSALMVSEARRIQAVLGCAGAPRVSGARVAPVKSGVQFSRGQLR